METTIVITPRDRYSGVIECIDRLCVHTPQPFALIVLDLGYPAKLQRAIQQRLDNLPNASLVNYGLQIPMEALRRVRREIKTPTTVLLDNDSQVTEGWLPPLLAVCNESTPVVSPLIFERDGLDQGAEIRNHLSTADIRAVEYQGDAYLIENKHARRAAIETLPTAIMPTETFELHCVMWHTATLQTVDIPQMVVREHIDLALQVRAKGASLILQPESQIVFDNLSTRMHFRDMRYFFFRWDEKLAKQSHTLFQQRWGHKFYSEQSMYNWAFRRKAYLLARFLMLPNRLANLVANGSNRLFRKQWDPLADPDGDSQHFEIPVGTPNLG